MISTEPLLEQVRNPEDWRLDYKLETHSKITCCPAFIKFGGSLFREKGKEVENVDSLIYILMQMFEQGNPIILTTGGGMSQAILKDMKDLFQISEQTYGKSSQRALETQAEFLADRFKQKGASVEYFDPRSLEYITDDVLKKNIVVVSRLSSSKYLKYIFVPKFDEEGNEIGKEIGKGIPKDSSDSQTLALATYFKVKRVIFAKYTDGVYLRDPHLKNGAVQTALQKRTGVFKFQNGNPFYDEIFASQILNGEIIRIGRDEREEHLAESLALRYLLAPSSEIEYIHVVNGTKPEMVMCAVLGKYDIHSGKCGSHILKG